MKDLWIVANGRIYQAIEFNQYSFVCVDIETNMLHTIGYSSDMSTPRLVYTSLSQAQVAAQNNPLAMRRSA